MKIIRRDIEVPLLNIDSAGNKRIDNSKTEPKLVKLPGKRMSAFLRDLKSGFGTIKDIMLAPFLSIKPLSSGKSDIVASIFHALILPFTAPPSIAIGILLTPVALISAAISFAVGRTTMHIQKGVKTRSNIPQDQ